MILSSNAKSLVRHSDNCLPKENQKEFQLAALTSMERMFTVKMSRFETDGRPLGIKLGAVAIVSEGVELGWLVGPVLIEERG